MHTFSRGRWHSGQFFTVITRSTAGLPPSPPAEGVGGTDDSSPRLVAGPRHRRALDAHEPHALRLFSRPLQSARNQRLCQTPTPRVRSRSLRLGQTTCSQSLVPPAILAASTRGIWLGSVTPSIGHDVQASKPVYLFILLVANKLIFFHALWLVVFTLSISTLARLTRHWHERLLPYNADVPDVKLCY